MIYCCTRATANAYLLIHAHLRVCMRVGEWVCVCMVFFRWAWAWDGIHLHFNTHSCWNANDNYAWRKRKVHTFAHMHVYTHAQIAHTLLSNAAREKKMVSVFTNVECIQNLHDENRRWWKLSTKFKINREFMENPSIYYFETAFGLMENQQMEMQL